MVIKDFLHRTAIGVLWIGMMFMVSGEVLSTPPPEFLRDRISKPDAVSERCGPGRFKFRVDTAEREFYLRLKKGSYKWARWNGNKTGDSIKIAFEEGWLDRTASEQIQCYVRKSGALTAHKVNRNVVTFVIDKKYKIIRHPESGYPDSDPYWYSGDNYTHVLYRYKRVGDKDSVRDRADEGGDSSGTHGGSNNDYKILFTEVEEAKLPPESNPRRLLTPDGQGIVKRCTSGSHSEESREFNCLLNKSLTNSNNKGLFTVIHPRYRAFFEVDSHNKGEKEIRFNFNEEILELSGLPDKYVDTKTYTFLSELLKYHNKKYLARKAKEKGAKKGKWYKLCYRLDNINKITFSHAVDNTAECGTSASDYTDPVPPSEQHPSTLPLEQRSPAHLIVRSNVSGDTVIIDDELMRSTGPEAYQLAPGEHTIRVEKAGYEPFETRIWLAAGEKETVQATLVSKTRKYQVVFLDLNIQNNQHLRRILAKDGQNSVKECILREAYNDAVFDCELKGKPGKVINLIHPRYRSIFEVDTRQKAQAKEIVFKLKAGMLELEIESDEDGSFHSADRQVLTPINLQPSSWFAVLLQNHANDVLRLYTKDNRKKFLYDLEKIEIKNGFVFLPRKEKPKQTTSMTEREMEWRLPTLEEFRKIATKAHERYRREPYKMLGKCFYISGDAEKKGALPCAYVGKDGKITRKEIDRQDTGYLVFVNQCVNRVVESRSAAP
uniref:PEGA domain-containing protein n=1 Tax=Candidatus Kentrum sp. FW TaxID=2126338 RepID=A0A450T1D6_9GAMM|nr:MAG: PEGA domain-containing protein [Candidatus Kentron sp. FW]